MERAVTELGTVSTTLGLLGLLLTTLDLDAEDIIVNGDVNILLGVDTWNLGANDQLVVDHLLFDAKPIVERPQIEGTRKNSPGSNQSRSRPTAPPS